ncbi:MAG: F0F1 ATP synthase subunit A [Acholeplasmataceae bacterium]|nr:F0F1 ATP synthase subunit A [Acholeplasmataceae bacterium]
MINQILEYFKNLPGYFVTSLIIIASLSIISVIVGLKVKHLDPKARPGKVITMFISFVSFFNNYVRSYVGKHWTYVAPITLSMAIYVLISNIAGVVNIESPTSFTAITFSLSLVAVFVVQSTGIRSQGVIKHFGGLTKPFKLMTPLNIIGDITPALSIALRLFGNIASGAVIVTLAFRGLMMLPFYASWTAIFIKPVLSLLFDVAFGLIQTLVIVLLTIIFASTKVDDADLEIN